MAREPEPGENRWEVYRPNREPVPVTSSEPSSRRRPRRHLTRGQAVATLVVGLVIAGVRIAAHLDDDEPDRDQTVTITRIDLTEDPFASPGSLVPVEPEPIPSAAELARQLPTVEPERAGVAPVLTVPGLRRLFDAVGSEVRPDGIRFATIYPTSAVVFASEDWFEPAVPYRWTGEFLLPDSTREPVEDDRATLIDVTRLRPQRLLALVPRASRLLGQPATETALLLAVDLPVGVVAGFARAESGKEAFVFAAPNGDVLAEIATD